MHGVPLPRNFDVFGTFIQEFFEKYQVPALEVYKSRLPDKA